MDPTAALYQQALLNLTLTLAKYNVDGIQLDSFPHGRVPICYDKDHDHPIGGGNWCFHGWQDILIRIRNEARKINTNFVLTSEGIAEVYLPYLDGFNEETINTISPDFFKSAFTDLSKISFIPLWHTVYHEFSVAYGVNISLHSIHITQTNNSSLTFYLRAIGMHAMQGIIPNAWVSSSTFLTFSPELNTYFQKVALSLKTYGKDFIRFGEILRPPKINVPMIQSGWVYQLPGSGFSYPPFTFPSVISSAWLSTDGRIAYFFTNVANRTIDFDFTIDLTSESVPNETRALYEIRDGSIHSLGIYNGFLKIIKLTIAPREILMLLLAPLNEDPTVTTKAVEMGGKISP